MPYIDNSEQPTYNIIIYRIVNNYGGYKSNWFLIDKEAIDKAKLDGYRLDTDGVELEINLLMVSRCISNEIHSLTI